MQEWSGEQGYPGNQVLTKSRLEKQVHNFPEVEIFFKKRYANMGYKVENIEWRGKWQGLQKNSCLCQPVGWSRYRPQLGPQKGKEKLCNDKPYHRDAAKQCAVESKATSYVPMIFEL